MKFYLLSAKLYQAIMDNTTFNDISELPTSMFKDLSIGHLNQEEFTTTFNADPSFATDYYLRIVK